MPDNRKNKFKPEGLLKPPTLDPNTPIAHVNNPDGTSSTVRTIGIGIENGQQVLIPTVHPDGYIMDDDAAVEYFRKTGKHFGIYRDVASSNKAGAYLSKLQAGLPRRSTEDTVMPDNTDPNRPLELRRKKSEKIPLFQEAQDMYAPPSPGQEGISSDNSPPKTKLPAVPLPVYEEDPFGVDDPFDIDGQRLTMGRHTLLRNKLILLRETGKSVLDRAAGRLFHTIESPMGSETRFLGAGAEFAISAREEATPSVKIPEEDKRELDKRIRHAFYSMNIGALQQISQELSDAYGVEDPVIYAELDNLMNHIKDRVQATVELGNEVPQIKQLRSAQDRSNKERIRLTEKKRDTGFLNPVEEKSLKQHTTRSQELSKEAQDLEKEERRIQRSLGWVKMTEGDPKDINDHPKPVRDQMGTGAGLAEELITRVSDGQGYKDALGSMFGRLGITEDEVKDRSGWISDMLGVKDSSTKVAIGVLQNRIDEAQNMGFLPRFLQAFALVFGGQNVQNAMRIMQAEKDSVLQMQLKQLDLLHGAEKRAREQKENVISKAINSIIADRRFHVNMLAADRAEERLSGRNQRDLLSLQEKLSKEYKGVGTRSIVEAMRFSDAYIPFLQSVSEGTPDFDKLPGKMAAVLDSPSAKNLAQQLYVEQFKRVPTDNELKLYMVAGMRGAAFGNLDLAGTREEAQDMLSKAQQENQE